MNRNTNADVTTSSGGENKPMLAAGLSFRMPKHTKKYDTIWQLMNNGDYLLEKGCTLYGTWYKCIAGAIYLEFLFKSEVEQAGKLIYRNLPELSTFTHGDSSILKWAEKTYDVNHPLRNNVETLDNVEEVKVFLETHNKNLFNLLKKTQPTFTFKVDV